MLAYGVRLSYREIATKLGIPPSTTGTRLLRVRAKVRRRLERVYEERCRERAEVLPATSASDLTGVAQKKIRFVPAHAGECQRRAP